jgi:hypothetical protein
VASAIVGAGELLAVVVVALLVAGSAAVVGALWLRRRWARLWTLAARHAGRLAREASTAGWRRLWSVQLPDHQWRVLHRDRRQLWRAVADTECAVQGANAAGAPLGDLASLARRLREAATKLDCTLRIAQRSTGSSPDVSSLSEEAQVLLAAAGHIRHSAAVTLTATSEPVGGQLLEDARLGRGQHRRTWRPAPRPFVSIGAPIAPR